MVLFNEVPVLIHESLLLRLGDFKNLCCHNSYCPEVFFWKISWPSDITLKISYLLWKISLSSICMSNWWELKSGNRTPKSPFSKTPSKDLQGSVVAPSSEVSVGESRLLWKLICSRMLQLGFVILVVGWRRQMAPRGVIPSNLLREQCLHPLWNKVLPFHFWLRRTGINTTCFHLEQSRKGLFKHQ